MANIYTSADQLIGKTPLLELTHIERSEGLEARILAKLEYLNPAGSVKDRIAKAMIDDAEAKGSLNTRSVIIEPTSGNTGIGLASVAAARGYRIILVMPDTMSVERRQLMKAYGAELVLTEGVKGMKGAIAKAEELAKEEDLVFLCGHYEGIDERALELIATDYLSVGDYVLTGGELPAMVMIDCISRLVPGVLNNDASAKEESFRDSLLEYPQYTRPEVFRKMEVPEVLLSGHHKNIEEWRRQQSIKRTLERRPDLLEHAALTMKEVKYLDSLRREKGDLEILEELIDQYVKSLNDEASAGRTKRKAMAAAKKLLAEKACTVRELEGYFKVMGMLAGG